MIRAPIEPPAETKATIAFHDGHIWHRTENGWTTLEPCDPHALLTGFRQDARAGDYFSERAGQLADQLEAAMQAAGLINVEKAA